MIKDFIPSRYNKTLRTKQKELEIVCFYNPQYQTLNVTKYDRGGYQIFSNELADYTLDSWESIQEYVLSNPDIEVIYYE